MDKHIPIEETEVFALFEACSEWVWTQVVHWNKFAQQTLGDQFVRAIDSVGLNLVEGDGRYTVRDSLKFFVYARASAREARLCLVRAMKRNLVPRDEGESEIGRLTLATKQLNLLINYRREAAKTMTAKEDRVLDYVAVAE